MQADKQTFSTFDVKQVFDSRGAFVKIISGNQDVLPGVEESWSECFFTTSRRGAIRGMHFQRPPDCHAKIIYCLAGEIVDVGLDLRKGTAGKVNSAVLAEGVPKAVYLPSGFAHGFQVLSDTATVLYLQSTSHVPESDTGIRYSSFGFDWPLAVSDVSERDLALPDFNKNETYF